MSDLICWGVTASIITGWYGHISSCITTHDTALLIAGLAVPPLGIIHGLIALLS